MKLDVLAEALGRKPAVIYGYLCEKKARAWSRKNRDTRSKSTKKIATGERNVAARLSTAVSLHKGTGVVLKERGTAVLSIAMALGLKATITDDGLLLELDTAAPANN